MANKLKRILPTLAIVGACVWAADMVLLGVWKEVHPGDDTSIRSSVERSLAGLRGLLPDSAEDPALSQGVKETLNNPHVRTVWLLTSDGRFVLNEGATAASTPTGSTSEDLATDDARGLIAVLPGHTFTEEQVTWLLAASAIRREGSHNDIYRHLLRPIEGRDGSTVALVGVAYEHAGWTAGPGWMMAVVLAVVSLAIYWLALPLWILLDGLERGERAAAWAVFVLLGNLVGLLAYFLVRSPQTGSPEGGWR